MKNAFVGDKQVIKVMLGEAVLWQKKSKTVVDFVNQTYGDGLAFSDVFEFNRPSKAWLAKSTTIDEYAANTPRLDNGLLIEQQATNYASYSFLPATGVSYLKNGFEFLGGFWTIVPSTSNRYLYPRPYPPSIVGDFVASVGTVQAVYFDYIVAGGGRVPITGSGKVNYGTSIGLDTVSTFGAWHNTDSLNGTQLLYLQLEHGLVPTSPIKTLDAPATRAADVLTLKKPATSIKGEWDATLNLSLNDGQLVHSGYGRIRSLTIE